MRGIDGAFQRLDPVGGGDHAGKDDLIRGQMHPGEVRKGRALCIGFASVDPQQTACLAHPRRTHAHLLAPSGFALVGCLFYRTVLTDQPAVVNTAQTVVFDACQRQRTLPMRAKFIERNQRIVAASQHKVFPQQPDLKRATVPKLC